MRWVKNEILRSIVRCRAAASAMYSDNAAMFFHFSGDDEGAAHAEWLRDFFDKRAGP